MRWACNALLCLGSVLAAKPAGAQSTVLDWRREAGADACLGATTASMLVEEALGRSAFSDHADSTLRVALSAVGEGFAARVELHIAGQEPRVREIHTDASQCRRLDDALVVVMALLLDEARAAIESANPAPTTATFTELEVAVSPPPLGAEGVEARGLGLALRLMGALRVGLLPGAPFGFGVEGGLLLVPRLALVMGGWIWPRAQARLDEQSGAKFLAAYGRIALCPQLYRAGRLRLTSCAGADVGVLQASGFGLRPDYSSRFVDVVLHATAGVLVQLVDNIGFRADLGVAMGPVRRDYVVDSRDGTTVLHSPWWVGPEVRLGIEFRRE